MTTDTASIQFLGAAGTVTGSMHLVTAGGRQILLDCGLFQGLKDLRLRNWRDFPFDPKRLDGVVISHAHIDHTGSLPLLARRGYRGPIYCTPATAELLGVLLPDAAHLQEEEAERANRKGYSKHVPALPLYTTDDANAALAQLQPRSFHEPFVIAGTFTIRYRLAGHILGSATIEAGLPGGSLIGFSGDLGRYDRPILLDPEPVPAADVLLLESTYGDRRHVDDVPETLTRVVGEAAQRGGALLVPAFVVDRTQELLWYLQQLEQAGKIPVLPVYVDSPSATEVSQIYRRHPDEFDPEMAAEVGAGNDPLRMKSVTYCRTQEESRRLNDLHGPVIIISASGMATGGRILHHLSQRLPDPKTTVMLVGYQSAGTRGRALQDGAKTLRMFGQDVPVRARVEQIHGLSAHADQDEILRWLGGFTRPPRQTWLVHGEPEGARALADTIRARLQWSVEVAAMEQRVPLAG